MKKIVYLFALLCLVLLSSCVSRQRYNELAEQLSYYKGEALDADSVSVSNLNLTNEGQQSEAELYKARSVIEEMRATNISLNRSYQDILNRYNAIVEQSQAQLTLSSAEQGNLRAQLTARESELDRKERELDQLEYQLRAREDELRRVDATTPNAYSQTGSANADAQRARLMAQAKQDRMERLQTNILQTLNNYPPQDIIVDMQDGNVILSVNPRLLFGERGDAVIPEGQQMAQQLVGLLNQYADVKLSIINTGVDYGVNRAANLINVLLSRGFQIERIDMGGRAFRSSIQPGIPPRVEIELRPSLRDIYQELNR